MAAGNAVLEPLSHPLPGDSQPGLGAQSRPASLLQFPSASAPPHPPACADCGTPLAEPYRVCPSCGLRGEDPDALPAYIIDRTTGLYNHRYLQPLMENELARVVRDRLPLGLLLFESSGDPAGATVDVALRSMGEMLASRFRQTDLCGVVSRDPARLLVLLPNTDIAETGHVANRLVAAVEAESAWQAAAVRIGVVCVTAGSALVVDQVLEAALRSAQSGRPELM